MQHEDIGKLAADIVAACRTSGIRIATAESCTGGLISAALTDIPGSSEALDRGFVTYSNAAKVEMLGVTEAILARHGAVSEEAARAMAEGALNRALAQIAVAVTGIAGPGGGSAKKPVGRVHMALARRDRQTRHEQLDFGDIGRGGVRQATVLRALQLLKESLGSG